MFDYLDLPISLPVHLLEVILVVFKFLQVWIKLLWTSGRIFSRPLSQPLLTSDIPWIVDGISLCLHLIFFLWMTAKLSCAWTPDSHKLWNNRLGFFLSHYIFGNKLFSNKNQMHYIWEIHQEKVLNSFVEFILHTLCVSSMNSMIMLLVWSPRTHTKSN